MLSALTPKNLKNYSSEDALNIIMQTYQINAENYYLAFDLIQSKSWKKSERKKLADYYLSKLPFASNKPYIIFLKIMPLKELLEIISTKLPSDSSKMNLLIYHLESIQKNSILNEQENILLSEFIDKIKQA